MYWMIEGEKYGKLSGEVVVYTDTKTVSGTGWYNVPRNIKSGAVVKGRQDAVQKGAEKAAKRYDTLHDPSGAETPFADTLAAVGGVRGLVVGRYAELSPHLLEMLKYLAQRQARIYAAQAGIEAETALGPFLSAITSTVVLFAVRGWARVRIKAAQDIISPPSAIKTRGRPSPVSSAHLFETRRFDAY